MVKFRAYIVLVFCLVCCATLPGQIEIVPAHNGPGSISNPVGMIENTFIGDGVEIVSIDFEGVPITFGQFSNAQDYIGINDGIMMTTGKVEDASKNGNDEAINNSIGGGITDPDILKLISGTTDEIVRDVSIIKIVFRPETDTLRFKYIWASEEYPDFVCSAYNDVFGFIISGPGFNGVYENNGENIALIPETQLPVAINTLNNGMKGDPDVASDEYCTSLDYAQYFVDNNRALQPPVYDGFSVPLEAIAKVEPCQEYTIKLLIADLGDATYDSAVFLEAGSFRTNTLQVDVLTASNDNTIVEGCGVAEVKLSTNFARSSTTSLDAKILGSAVNGVDYTTIDEVSFELPANETEVSIRVEALEDGITEGLDSVLIAYQRSPCSAVDTILIYIKDNELTAKDIPDTVYVCGSGETMLDATSPVAIPEDQFFESEPNLMIEPEEQEVYADIQVSGVQTYSLHSAAMPTVCVDIEHLYASDIDLYLLAPNGTLLELSTDNGGQGSNYTSTCFATTAVGSITDGEAPFTGEFLPEGDFNDLIGCPSNGRWRLVMIDDAMGFQGSLVKWSITFPNTYGISYAWTPDLAISDTQTPTVTVSPSSSALYQVAVTDTYGCIVEDSTQIVVQGDYAFQADTVHVACYGEATGSLTVDPLDSDVTLNWETGQSTNTIEALVAGDYCVVLKGDSGCEQSLCFTIDEASPLLADISNTGAGCEGENNGALAIQPTGGTAPYIMTWSHTSDAAFDLADLGPDQYIGTVTDANGCTIVIDERVEETAPFNLATDAEDVSCAGQNDGNIDLTVTGNTGMMRYSWTGPSDYASSAAQVSGLSPGEYTVIITEEGSCSVSRTFQIKEPNPIQIGIEKEDILCHGETTGSISIQANGGQAPLSYSISRDASFSDQSVYTDLAAGTYTVVVKDAEGCEESYSDAVILQEPQATLIDLQNSFEIVYGESVNLEATTSLDPAAIQSIIWEPSEALSCGDCLSTSVAPEYSTVYTLTITDTLGCTTVERASIAVDRTPRVTMANIFSPNGDNANDAVMIQTDEVLVKSIKQFQIYDRWGELVFTIKDQMPNSPDLAWDGKHNGQYVAAGVYLWVAQVELDGEEEKVYAGDVTVIK